MRLYHDLVKIRLHELGNERKKESPDYRCCEREKADATVPAVTMIGKHAIHRHEGAFRRINRLYGRRFSSPK
jgi:hypothetical protein